MGKDFRAVIFDLDGTLVDAYAAVAESFNHALRQLGFPGVDFDTVKRNVGWGERVLVSRFVPEHKIDDLLEIYRAHHRSALPAGVKFLPGAQETLTELRHRGMFLAIASNRPSPFTRVILECLEVNELFDLVVCGDQVERPKPAGDMLVKILEAFSLGAEEAVYVGDMVVDVETGRAAGVKTVAVLTGSSHEQEIRDAAPLEIIRGMPEFIPLLERMQQKYFGIN